MIHINLYTRQNKQLYYTLTVMLTVCCMHLKKEIKLALIATFRRQMFTCINIVLHSEYYVTLTVRVTYIYTHHV